MTTNSIQHNAELDRLLYPFEIDKLLSGGGQPVSIRISQETNDSILAEARITGVAPSAVARKRIAAGLQDADMTPDTRLRQLEARDLRRAMQRAVYFSDEEMTRHISTLRRIANGSTRLDSEILVYETEQQLRYGEAARARTLLECRLQASDGDPVGAIERFRSVTGCGLTEAYAAVTGPGAPCGQVAGSEWSNGMDDFVRANAAKLKGELDAIGLEITTSIDEIAAKAGRWFSAMSDNEKISVVATMRAV